MPCKCRRRYPRAGFTLVELMVVIVIIGLLAGVATFSVRSYLVTSRQNIAKMEIFKICQALDSFYSVYDRYPTNEEGLEILAQPSEKFADGVLNKVPRDPWSHAYEYTHPGRSHTYEVVCFGRDGREGGEGEDRDIASWALDE